MSNSPSDNTNNTDHASDVGLGLDKGKQRDNNEDSLGTVAFAKDGTTVEVYVLADGMGGYASGETASKMVVDSVLQLGRYIEHSPLPQDYSAWLDNAIHITNDTIRQQAAQSRNKMGSTIVVAVVINDNVYVASVGDSRAYVISPDGIRQVTHDHSFVQALLDSGAITKEQAEHHPYLNILTESVGQSDSLKVDLFVEQLGSKSKLLLCSDGLWKSLGNERIWQIVQAATNLKDGCKALVDVANEVGGEDNISAVLVQSRTMA